MKATPLLLLFFLSLSNFLPGQTLSSKDKHAIMAVFTQQEQAWNAGDIDAFMEGYLRSDSLTFVGGSGVTYGWEATRAGYFRRYPNRATMGKLSFAVIRLESLGKRTAHLIGSWHLEREMGDIGGHFSLIWRKVNGQWLIVSDHTSAE